MPVEELNRMQGFRIRSADDIERLVQQKAAQRQHTLKLEQERLALDTIEELVKLNRMHYDTNTVTSSRHESVKETLNLAIAVLNKGLQPLE